MKKEITKETSMKKEDKGTKPVSDVMSVKLKKPHRHNGVYIEVGTTIEVTPRQVDFLKSKEII